jgi:hypothetical protein
MYSMVLLGGLAVLIAGCATDPVPPSLPKGEFVVIVKGEPEPLEKYSKIIDGHMMASTLPGCKREVPPSNDKGAPSGLLVYHCTAPRAESGKLLESFATAFGNSVASLLEIRITTSAACVARSCWGGPLRYWRQTPPCALAC